MTTANWKEDRVKILKAIWRAARWLYSESFHTAEARRRDFEGRRERTPL
jgi:hypothetical protein